MRTVVRVLPSLCALIVALASFGLSYIALRDMAIETEAVPAWAAWMVPVVIDVGTLCACAVIWANSYLERRREWFPFAVAGVLVTVSVIVNTAHAGPSPLAKMISALPPLVLLATIEMVAGQHRKQLGSAATAAAPAAPPEAPRAASPSTGRPATRSAATPATPRRSASKRTGTSTVRTAPAATSPTPLEAELVPLTAVSGARRTLRVTAEAPEPVRSA